MAYTMLKYAKASGKRERLIYLVATGILCNLYWWWYFHSGLIFGMLLCLLIYMLACNIRNIDEVKARFKKEFPLLILFCNPYVLFTGAKAFTERALHFVSNYLSPSMPIGFPNVFQSISELRKLPLEEIARVTIGGKEILLISLVLLGLMCLMRTKDLILVAIPLLTGLITLFGGNRFAMYLAPFLGVGLGFGLEEAFRLAEKSNIKSFQKPLFVETVKALIGLLVAVLICSSNFKEAKAVVAFPKVPPNLAEEFSTLPKGWIWTWWDYGYAITYYSGDGVFHDGGSQTTPKTYLVATTFSTPDPKTAHNVILGVSNVGAKWIVKAIKAGNYTAEEITRKFMNGYFAKPLKHKVYWAFTQDLVGKFTWINYFGTWDFKKKKGLWKSILPGGTCAERGQIIKCEKFVIDKNKGLVFLNRRAILINLLVKKTAKGITKEVLNDRGLIAEVVKERGRTYAYIMEKQPYMSLFNQMYILRNYDKRYFKLVRDHFPTIVIYQVSPIP